MFNRWKTAKTSTLELTNLQRDFFSVIGVNWDIASRKVISLVGQHTDLKSHRSQHYELFVGISQLINPKRILEIGTADATFTQFLTVAYPEAIIETIDLPASDQRFWNATDEVKQSNDGIQIESQELKKRNEKIDSSSNVRFREINSLWLSRMNEEKYDLIWVDGDHTFPVVACDVANAVRLLSNQGVMICDDIYLSDGRKGRWGSDESYKTLRAFSNANIISLNFVLKSIRPEKNFNESVKKYLSISMLKT